MNTTKLKSSSLQPPPVAHTVGKPLFRRVAAVSLVVLATLAPGRAADVVKVFQVIAAASDIMGTSHNLLTVDNPYINGVATAKLIVTQNFHLSGVDNPHPVEVAYDYPSKKWLISNADGAAIEVGAGFNIRALKTGTKTFSVIATVGNSLFHHTNIKHAGLDRNPGAKILIQHNFHPPGVLGVSMPAYLGVFYNSTDQLWEIFNENFVPAAVIVYNVADISGEANAFVQTAAAGNLQDVSTIIDNPLTNGNPNAILFVTHNAGTTADGVTGLLASNRPLGVNYVGNKWAIFNARGPNMPAGESFNVEAFAGPVQ